MHFDRAGSRKKCVPILERGIFRQIARLLEGSYSKYRLSWIERAWVRMQGAAEGAVVRVLCALAGGLLQGAAEGSCKSGMCALELACWCRCRVVCRHREITFMR